MSESVASFRSGVSGLSSVAAFDLRGACSVMLIQRWPGCWSPLTVNALPDDGLDELALAGDLNRIKGQLEVRNRLSVSPTKPDYEGSVDEPSTRTLKKCPICVGRCKHR